MTAFWSCGSLGCGRASESVREDDELLLLRDVFELVGEGVMAIELAVSNDDWSQEDDRDGDEHSSVVSQNNLGA